jgi:cytidylate kinase
MADKPLITIDGTYASGRHTLAVGIAQSFNLPVISQDHALRLIAYQLLQGKRSFADTSAIRAEIQSLRAEQLQLSPIPSHLRTPELTDAAAEVAADPVIWTPLSERFRELAAAAKSGAVMVGTAMGRTLFPQAGLRLFLHAERKIRQTRESRRYGDLEGTPGSDLRVDQQDSLTLRRMDGAFRSFPHPNYTQHTVSKKADLKQQGLVLVPEIYFLTDRLDAAAVVDIGRTLVRQRFPKLSG